MSQLSQPSNLFFIALFSLLTACGGGSNNSDTNTGSISSPRQNLSPTTSSHTNRAPRINNIGNQQVTAGSGTKRINLSASDSDSQTVTFHAKQANGNDLPDFMYIESTAAKSGKLIVEGSYAEAGDYWTKITATDDEGANSSKTIKITVTTQRTVRILPLGDSITQARYDQLSYRYPLWKKLIDADKSFDFIGSQDQTYYGSRAWPTYNGHHFDQDHEGYSGMTADWMLYNANFHYDNPADIALIHLGTNDLLWTEDNGNTIKNNIADLINKLRDTNPNMKILVAKILPFDFNYPGHDVSDRYYDFTSRLSGLANDMSQANSPVIMVDMSDIYDLYDTLHPDANGEERMAQRWYNAMIDNGLL